ncbi:MAG: gliding motility-associated C-terminal domain-containing protein, partial [Bacteroidota bacterium]
CDVVIPTLINDITVANIQWFDPTGTLDCDTCLRPRATPFNETEYILTVTSADGCSTTDSLVVTVVKTRDVFQPTAFSPNGDGVNDTFILNPGKSTLAIASFRVYGRWGEQLFEGRDLVPNDLAAGWDGRRNGEPMPPGVYVWTAQVLFLDGETQELSGEVVLLR